MHDVKPNQDVAALAPARESRFQAVEGQIALVTGAGAGIGAATAKALGKAGAHVVLADIDGDAAQKTATAIDRFETTLAQTIDVSDPDQIRGLVECVVERYGRLDLVINNAGVATVAPLEDTTVESWRRTFAVNVDGCLLVMQVAFRVMEEQDVHPATDCRGKIINMSSPASEIGRPLLAAYGASKAAVNHLSKSAAVRWGDRLISTSIVYPGSVTGAMWPKLGYDLAAAEGRDPDEVIAERIAWTPAGRLQDPSEVAEIAMYVANFRGMALNGRTVWTESHVSVV